MEPNREPPDLLHDWKREIERRELQLRNAKRYYPDLPEGAAKAILGFVHSREREVSPARIVTYLRVLTEAAGRIGEDFLHPNKDTPGVVKERYRRNKGWTLATAGSCLAKFWQWHFARQDATVPPYLKVKVSKRELVGHKGPETVLTPEEVSRMADYAQNYRDAALIWTLYEGGLRIGEATTLRIGDVEHIDNGLMLHLREGKTGPRTVPLFSGAVPALLAWLRSHPRKDERTAPLFCGIDRSEQIGQPLTYNAFVKGIKKTAKRAGITKPINPHNFRHSRATEMARNPRISTSVLEGFFGWQHGSPMAATYVHLSGKDVEQSIRAAYGLAEEAKPAPTMPKPKVCLRCKTASPSEAIYCSLCAAPLDPAAVVEQGSRIAELERQVQLMRNASNTSR